MDDDTRVCGQCGVPADDNFLQEASGGGDTGSGNAKKKPWIKLIIALVLVVCIATVAIKVATNYTGRRGLVRKVMKAYVDYDIDSLMSMASDIYFYQDHEQYGEMYFENTVGSTIDYFENSVGHSYKTSYEIEEVYELSNRKHDELIKSLEYSYSDYDFDSIKNISAAKVKITAKQDKKSVNSTIQITMVKEGDKWKVLTIN